MYKQEHRLIMHSAIAAEDSATQTTENFLLRPKLCRPTLFSNDDTSHNQSIINQSNLFLIWTPLSKTHRF